jgi:hypothetical protein
VPLEDFEGWRDAFLSLRDNQAFMRETGARAKALVSRCFTLDRMIDGFEATIMETEKHTWVPAGKSYAVERADSTP